MIRIQEEHGDFAAHIMVTRRKGDSIANPFFELARNINRLMDVAMQRNIRMMLFNK